VRSMGPLSRRQLLVGLAGVSALGLAGCGGSEESDGSLYVVGDSITAADSDLAALSFAEASWVAHLDPRLNVVGAWAAAGATTEDMANGVERSDAHTLVVLTGASDVGRVAFERTAYYLEEIIDRVRARRVVVSTLPPRDPLPQLHTQFNQNLGLLTKDKGWRLCDPMEGVRSGVLWAPGMSDDGVHPTAAAASRIGQALSECLLDAS